MLTLSAVCAYWMRGSIGGDIVRLWTIPVSVLLSAGRGREVG